jgi:hypothetical protein
MFEEWPSEEDDDQKHCSSGVKEGHGPKAEQLEHVLCWYIVFIEDVYGKKGANYGGKGHRPCSGAYGRGRIASESW